MVCRSKLHDTRTYVHTLLDIFAYTETYVLYTRDTYSNYIDCPLVVVVTCTPYCKSGGSCKSDLMCSCSIGWTGKDCSQGKCIHYN